MSKSEGMDYRAQAEALVKTTRCEEHGNVILEGARTNYAVICLLCLEAALRAAAAEEREQCASYAREYAYNGLGLGEQECDNLALNIRRRSDRP